MFPSYEKYGYKTLNIKIRISGRILLENNYLLYIKSLCKVLIFNHLIYTQTTP